MKRNTIFGSASSNATEHYYQMDFESDEKLRDVFFLLGELDFMFTKEGVLYLLEEYKNLEGLVSKFEKLVPDSKERMGILGDVTDFVRFALEEAVHNIPEMDEFLKTKLNT